MYTFVLAQLPLLKRFILFCTEQTKILGSRTDSLAFLAGIIGTRKRRRQRGHFTRK